MSSEAVAEAPKLVPVTPPTVEFREYVLYPGSRTEIRRVIQGSAPQAHADVKLTYDVVGVRAVGKDLDVVWPWSVIRGITNVQRAK